MEFNSVRSSVVARTRRQVLNFSANAPLRAHDSTHGREVHPEVLSDLRIAVLASIVRREDSAAAIWVRLRDACRRFGRDARHRPDRLHRFR